MFCGLVCGKISVYHRHEAESLRGRDIVIVVVVEDILCMIVFEPQMGVEPMT